MAERARGKPRTGKERRTLNPWHVVIFVKHGLVQERQAIMKE
ncbi:MAG: hypothetical protein WCE25_12565 [Nitrososphaeraceae archaeon]